MQTVKVLLASCVKCKLYPRLLSNSLRIGSEGENRLGVNISEIIDLNKIQVAAIPYDNLIELILNTSKVLQRIKIKRRSKRPPLCFLLPLLTKDATIIR
jgi:hypothetical protein